MNIKIKDRVFLLFILFLVIFALSCYKKTILENYQEIMHTLG